MNDLMAQQSAHAALQTYDELLEHFHQVSNAKCVLWINPAQYDPFETHPLAEEYRVPIPIRHPRFDVNHGPYLLPLDLTDSTASEVLKQSVELAYAAWTTESLTTFSGQPIAGWIETHASTRLLAAHWARHCYIHRHRKLTKLLRFHDPGVREWLWSLLTSDQQDALLGLAECIWGIGRDQVLQHQVRSGALVTEDLTHSLIVEEQQWAQIDDYAAVHAAWIGCLKDPGKKENDPAWAPRVFKALDSATRYGITHPQDRELFALHALRLGSDFHTSVEMRPIWKETAAGHHYGNVLEDVFNHPADQLHLYFENR